MTRPARRGLVTLLGAAPGCLGLGALVTSAAVGQVATPTPWLVPPSVVVVLAPAVVGLLILRRDPRHVVGWLLCVHAGLFGLALSTPPARPHTPTDYAIAQLTAAWWVFFYLGLVLLAYVFPSGHAAGPRWRTWIAVCVGGYAATVVGRAGDREAFTATYPGHEPPLPVFPQLVADVLGVGGFVLVGASLLGAVVCVRRRLRAATGVERLQLLWFAWSAVTLPVMLVVCFVGGRLVGSTDLVVVAGLMLIGGGLPVVLGVAILRHRLFDIELVLSRSLVYAALTAGVLGGYGLLLWGSEALAGGSRLAGLVAVGAVAVAIQPAHAWLRRRVERWVYGDRRDPGVALRRLSARVEGAPDAEGIRSSVATAVADALRVPSAWLDDTVAAEPAAGTVRAPLVYRGERLGDLVVTVPPGRTLSAADAQLLDDLARHAAVVVHAVRLSEDVSRSRAQLVTAREEERRRLRRDLHDGLGPSLAAIVLKLNAAGGQADATGRDRILAETREEARAAVAEVRRLVEDLRPPAIDELGLLPAIGQRARSLGGSRGLAIDVTGADPMPPLPAAVEVAAYRIAVEGVTNVLRHSTATRCHVDVAIDDPDSVVVTVTDDGDGAQDDVRPGVGWTSMAERAAELGGRCTITSGERGLVVTAVLPLAESGSTLAPA